METKFNLDEAVIEQFRFVNLYNRLTGKLEVRLTSVENPSLDVTSEKDEVIDAYGSTVAEISKAKKASFSGENTYWNFELAARQYGSTKEVATSAKKIIAPANEVVEVTGTTITLKHTPAQPIKYIYKLSQGNIAEVLKVDASTATSGKFTIADGVITLPAGSDGTYLIDYVYESDKAFKVANKSDQHPEEMMFKASVYLRNRCTNEQVLAWIVADKAKLDASQVQTALNSQGKHPINLNFLKNPCVESADLFNIIVVND